MLRILTTIGVLIAIALPLIDVALFRPGRQALGRPRLAKVERIIYLLFLLAVALQAISSFGSILAGGRMQHWMLVMHMSVAGLFAVSLTALSLLWAEQSSFGRAGEERFCADEKVAFWLTLVTGFSTLTSAMLGMMSWFGSPGQIVLLKIHRYSALLLLICAVFHGYRLLAGRPRAKTDSAAREPVASAGAR